MTQPVPRVALEGHGGADGQIVAQPDAVHGDTRVHTWVGVQRDHYWGGNISCVIWGDWNSGGRAGLSNDWKVGGLIPAASQALAVSLGKTI